MVPSTWPRKASDGFQLERKPLPAMALTCNSSVITAIGNDYGFDEVFARQLRGLARAGDVVVGIPTSGRSGNVVAAFKAAKNIGALSIAFTGAAPSPMSVLAELNFCGSRAADRPNPGNAHRSRARDLRGVELAMA